MKSWTYFRLILLSFILAACSRNPLGEDLSQPILNLGFLLSQSCTNTLNQDAPYTCTIIPNEIIPNLNYTIEPGTTCTWAAINPVTAVVTGVPNDNQVGTCQLVIGSKSTKRKALPLSYNIQIQNIAPTLTVTNAANILEDAALTVIRTDAAVQASEEGFGTYRFDNLNTTVPRCSDNATALVVDANTGAISYAPALNYNGTCNIRVVFDDGNAVANSTVSSEFSITVLPINDAPTIAPIANQSTFENIAAVIPMNIVDVDSAITCGALNVSATSSVTSIVSPSGISITGTIPNCTLTLTPIAFANGITLITVTATDGLLSSTRVFNLNVIPVPDPPVLLPIVNQLGTEDTPLVFNINMTDPDTVLACNSTFLNATSSNSSLLPVAAISYSGLPPNCTVTLIPVLNQNGSTNIVISLTDGPNTVTQAFTATFSSVNDAPILSVITNQTTNEDIPLVVNFTITDVDSPVNCVTSMSASSSNLTLLPTSGIAFGGTAPNCTATLTSLPDMNGVSNLSFTLSDGALTNVKNFTFTVNPVNDAPTLSVIANQTTLEDTPLTFGFILTDIDSAISCTTSMSATSSNLGLLPVSGISFGGTAPNCTVTFTTLLNQSGISAISFIANDGALTSTRNFNLTVTAVDDPPVLSVITNKTTNEDVSLVVNFTVNDPDTVLVCSTSMSATSSDGTLLPVANIVFGGTAPNCTATLTPFLNQYGLTNLVFTLTDGTTPVTQSFSLAVTSVNDAPVLSAIGPQSMVESTTSVISFTLNDVDSPVTCGASVSASTSNTTLLPLSGISIGGTAPNCTLTVTPVINVNGTTNISLTATDGSLTDIKNFTLTVIPYNDPPVIGAITNQTMAEDGTLIVSFNISDVDNTLFCNTSMSATSSNTALLPVAGIVFGGTAPSCTATISTALNANGLSNLVFTVSDGLLTDVRNFSLTVTPVNDAPVLSVITNQSTNEDTALVINFTINDVDNVLACNTSLAATSSNTALLPVGSIVFGGTAPNCTATFTPSLDAFGVSNLGFTVTDGTLTDVKNFTFTVNAVNDAPILSTITNQTTAEDTPLIVNFTVNDVDSILLCTSLNLAATSSNTILLPIANIVFGGTAPNCTATLTSVANLSGLSNLSITLADNGTPNLQDVKSFTFTVSPVNDAPVLSTIANQTINEDGNITVNFTINDVDNILSCNTSVLATSSNAALLPGASILFGGTAPNCTVVLTPLANANGTSNLSFTLTDGTLTDIKNFTFTVNAVNDAPVMSTIANQATLQDVPIVVNFTITDVDNVLVCNTSVLATSSNTTLIPVGNIVFGGTAPNCTATMSPAFLQSGLSNISFTVTDGALTNVKNFVFSASSVNYPPTISAITAQSTNEDVPLVVNFTIGDVDSPLACNTSLTATSSNTTLLPVAGITFAGTAPNCTATLASAANLNGTSNLIFTVSDGTNTTPTSFTLTVTPVNDAPVLATISNQLTLENIPVVVNFTITDIDSTLVCNTAMTATSSNTTLLPVAGITFGGTAPNCTATLTSASSANGTSNISFTVSDGTLTDLKNFTLTVTPVNDPPVMAVITNQTTPEDTPLVVNFTITDVDSALVCGTSVSATSSNTTVLAVAGITFGGTAPNCTATLVPALNANGVSSLTFTVTDGTLTNAKSFTFTVTPVNDAPVMSTIANQTTPEDSPLVVNFTINDVDSILTCGTSVSATSSNTALLPVAGITFGGTAPNCTATLTTTLDASGVSNLSFTVTDGALTDIKNFTFTVTPVNDAPIIAAIANQTTPEDASLAVNFTITDVDSALNCTTSMSATSSNTTLIPVGSILFSGTAPSCTATITPTANLNGVSNLSFTVTDGALTDIKNFTFTVTPVNDAPIIAAIANQTTPEDVPLVVNFTITDIDSTLICGTSVSASSSNMILLPVSGIVFAGTAPNCTATITSAANLSGTANLSFTVTDGALTDLKSFTLTVTPVNDAPVLTTITNQITSEDVPIAVNFTITDIDSVLNCTSSMLAVSSNTTLVPVANILFSGTAPNCTATITSVANLNGVTNLSFTVTDGSLTDVKSFSLTVTAVNDAPVLSAISNQTTTEDTSLVINFTANDIDSVLLCSSLNLSMTSSNTALLPVANVVYGGTAPNCTATLTSTADANGVTNLSLTLMDNGTPNLQDVKNFTFTVTPVNDAPTMPAIANQTTNEDTALIVNFTIADVDNVLTCGTSLTASSSNVTTIPVASIVFSGTAPNCTATINPALNQNGNVNLTFRVSDGILFLDRTFQVTVTPVDDAPVISTIANQTILEDGNVAVNFTITDVDSILNCTTSMSKASSNITLLPLANIVFSGTAPNCTATLTPVLNGSGVSNITLTVTDGTTPVAQAFSLTVTAVNDPPVLSTISNQTTLEDIVLPVSFTITDPDDILSCTTSMSATSSNTALIPVANIVFSGTAPNCTATFTSVANAFGVSNISFTVTDGSLTDVKNFTFTATAVNDPPVMSTIGSQVTNEDTSLAIPFTISDVDNTLTCSGSMTASSNNTALVPVANVVFSGTAPNCTATVSPFLNANGLVDLTFTVTDGTTPVSQVFDLTVNAVNDNPVISAIGAQSTLEDTPLVVNFTITDVDSGLSCTGSMNRTSSNVTLMPVANIIFSGTAPNCTATFTPAANRFGATNVSFFVTDGIGSAIRTFNVSVIAVNDAPVISVISAQTTPEGTPIAINFTMSDVDNALTCTAGSLSMTSSNVALIPTANVVWSGTAPNCTGTISPAGTNYGTANINFIVTDGTLSTSSPFVQTVTNINQAPTITSIANQTIYEGRPNTINFTLFDNDGPLTCSATNLSATSSNTALVPVANVVFGGSYPNCTAVISLAAGQAGTSNLSIIVTDTIVTANAAFTVTGAKINAVALSPLTPIVPKNSNFSFALTATYSDGQTRNVTTASTWTTSNTAISSFPSAGVLNNTYAGAAVVNSTITGTYGSFSANTSATINPATVTSIIVNSTSGNINVGGTVQIKCIGITSDGGAIDLTQSCSWASANALIASVDNSVDKGLVTGNSLGSATNITATYGSFNASAAITVDSNPPAVSDDGTGLTASYYAGGTNFNTFANTRIDATVNFNWATGNNPAGSADSFSARWTGFIKAPTTGTFTIYTQSDDGVRMWVNGVQIINNWTSHGSIEDSGTVAMTAGVKYAVILEFFENTGSAQIELRYSGPSVIKQVIPQINLYP